MTAIFLCVVAFTACYFAGRRSLAQGLIALLVVGYFYGILRANVITTFSHFIFDAGLVGLYLSQDWGSSSLATRNPALLRWVLLLGIWPLLVCFLPFQPLMVSLVGLRGHIFFLPLLLLGTRLEEGDLLLVSKGLTVMNLIALGFAAAEYLTSVQQFFPFSPVTAIIYASGDVEGGNFRIPATFSNAHAFGGTMALSLPLLIGAWTRAQDGWQRTFALSGIGAALLGILMSATRVNFVIGSAAVLTVMSGSRMKTKSRAIFAVLAAAILYTALSNERFQRFKSLADTDAVVERVAGSVNRGFFELLQEYPMGNGLGGGGTSLPYFLQGEVHNPIGLESEYSRILCEQGVIGFFLWITFIVWILTQAPVAFMKDPWQNGRRLGWCVSMINLATGLIGVGMLTAVPGTMLFLMNLGWAITPSRRGARASDETRTVQPASWPRPLTQAVS